MRLAAQKDEAFLTDVHRARTEAGEGLHLWWLGQSGFLLQWKGRHLLLDPYLSDSLTQKYAGTDKEHIRMTERVVAPENLDFIDVVTTSHNHTDHLDADTLLPVFQQNPKIAFIGPEANRDFINDRLGIECDRMLGLCDGQSVEVEGIQFTGIAAAHNERELDAAGRDKFLGFIVEWGPWTIYHSGDTRLYEGLVDRLKRFRIDLAFLPINGFKPERQVAGNLNAKEAVDLAKKTEMAHVVPHHFHMFTFNTVEPDEFREMAEASGLAAAILENGERLTLPTTTNR